MTKGMAMAGMRINRISIPVFSGGSVDSQIEEGKVI